VQARLLNFHLIEETERERERGREGENDLFIPGCLLEGG